MTQNEPSKMRGLMLVAGREIRVRGLSKSNVISLVVTVVIVGILAALPSLIGGDDSDTRVGLSGDTAPAMQAQLEAMGGFDITVFDTADEAERAVEDETVDAAVADGSLFSLDGIGNEDETKIDAAWQTASVQTNLSDAGLSDQQIGEALTVQPLEFVTLESEGGVSSTLDYFTGLIISIIMFMMLMTPVQYIAMGVVEEKSSRIVEILLTSLKPWQLLGGKVIGLGVISLVNLIAMVAVGLGVSAATGMLSDLPPGTAGAAVSSIGWWLIAFALFGTLAGGVGSLVSRQEESGSVLTPLIMSLTLSYLGAIFLLNAPTSTFAEVLSIVPPFSGIAMPTRMAITEVPAWQIGLSALLLALAAAGALALGSQLYKRSVLYTGSRMKISEALRRAA
ncbi:ABC-2 type transport system permease protein [Glycomyces sambucus]|uniref:ABC-2 type transport system permease protein n=1 Tax=Glycomyces sambucus TaxID=380244 RepID=A0A1G9GY31_9ACTN|nr:ABC transporter permease [Glycomyces sambucus]SDL05484.1 ABC-2 type transport system permease protein [Glycomyces sambucus]